MWTQEEIYEQIQMINGSESPSLVITNATYLHSIYKKWLTGNIWIHQDRIIYAGEEMPEITKQTEIVDATGKKIVPGYIEPHVHPFQLYNPQTFAEFAGALGTTTFISDNLTFFMGLENKEIFSLLDQLKELPFSFYWWARMDSQTALPNEAEQFNPAEIKPWLLREDVLLAGELTAWPRLLAGDENIFATMQAAKETSKKIEGHLPGASEKTLARMKLLGVDGDHEAMTFEEVKARLLHGYAVTIRHSSIRPDLPHILKDIVDHKLNAFDHIMMTTDGSTPSFHADGVIDKCIQAALDAGVPPIDAYLMASYNVARYYNMTDMHGLIATGRYATLNLLEDEQHPVPTDVLSKGVWLKRDGQAMEAFPTVDWSSLGQFNPQFDLNEEDFTFDHAFGIEMVNDVITKPYEIMLDLSQETLANDHDESFIMLLDRHGSWRVNTLIKGFAAHVEGFATSYSNTGDVILIGKNKKSMLQAFNEIKRIGGGMVLIEQGEPIVTLPLPIGGGLSNEPVEVLMEQEIMLKSALKERGYHHTDAVYTFLFLQSTHLPYVRMTPIGIYDVMKNKVLVPVTER
ncbi:adenine deaminase C-terminal domain-containing protein [Sporosarcina pasteurii]|uniref:adenine deaminase n=1 Tax=Sporosarcina pasteurii TaxID=1474 RepID=A0A380CE24_SPOPA|nr:adenine deaminase C-terminal domain-containing protein [Sporosarcina pasteurii]MDS9473148.1 adenine deaminase C-terminal domain-containing protein [Sporosarcina pasteurii]QBQ04208.1 adenine deaminase [Sporosarcina pasteurii]SUJ17442.1 Putative adenine deaminase YerA [Sporosarcina pasteurii]